MIMDVFLLNANGILLKFEALNFKMKKFPTFFVVGAAKSGTSALWNYFQKHPDIFVTNDISIKELGYFSNQYGINDKNDYLNFFSNAKGNQIIGEVCHAYLTSEESAAWIKKEIPHSKIIIILRNPIDRAFSLYNWMIMEGYENAINFRKALQLEKSRKNIKLLHSFNQNYLYFESGMYYEQVKRYIDVFGKENVIVLPYEEFGRNELCYLNKIFNFLGVSKITSLTSESVNKSKAVRVVYFQYLMRKMLIIFKNRPRICRLILYIMKKNTTSNKPNQIAKELKEELKEKYRKDIEMLSKLCDCNFNKLWLYD